MAGRGRSLFALALGTVVLAAARRHAAGPPPSHTGGFGEPLCTECHSGDPVNTAGGSLTVRGWPEGWQPGAVYALTIELRRDDMEAGGFQLAVRTAADRDAGTLRPAQPGVAVVRDTLTGAHFIQHEAPVEPTAGRVTFAVEWVAPATASGVVQLDAAANASNWDNSPLGDYIYTFQARASSR